MTGIEAVHWTMVLAVANDATKGRSCTTGHGIDQYHRPIHALAGIC